MSDPYYYPNSHTLINKLGITDPEELHNAERDWTYLRETELLLFRPLDNLSFNFDTLKRPNTTYYYPNRLYKW